MKKSTALRVLGLIAGGSVAIIPMASPAAAYGETATASATGLRVSVGVLGISQSLSTTGLQTNNRFVTTLLATPVGLPAYADALRSEADSSFGYASSASTRAAHVNVPGVITATLVTSNASVQCEYFGPVASGYSYLTDVTIGSPTRSSSATRSSSPVPSIAPAPNTTYALPGGVTLVLNEQSYRGTRMIDRAIHVYGPSGLDVVVGESVASVDGCGSILHD